MRRYLTALMVGSIRGPGGIEQNETVVVRT